jgi:hypothetical protein
MDIIKNPSYEELQDIYSKYFALGNLSSEDVSNKFALISLICYVTEKAKLKKPDVTHYQIIRKIVGTSFPDDIIKGLAVVCSDFAYGCTIFPTFGIEGKNIPLKIKELILSRLPF